MDPADDAGAAGHFALAKGRMYAAPGTINPGRPQNQALPRTRSDPFLLFKTPAARVVDGFCGRCLVDFSAITVDPG